MRDIRDHLFWKFPVLETAYNLNEVYITFNEQNDINSAIKNFDFVRQIFGDCGIDELEPFYNLLGNWKQEIINSFTLIDGRQINSSYIESKNRLIGKLIPNAHGLTDFKITRNRIMYCLNKNDTYTL